MGALPLPFGPLSASNLERRRSREVSTKTTATRDEPSGHRRGWTSLAAVALIGLAAYANAFGGAFVFDDKPQIRDNLALRDLGALVSWNGFLRFPQRWVAQVTFALNQWIGGLAPVGYHAVNVAIHLANALLVHALIVLAFRTPRLARSTLAPHARAIAFVAAALFVTHPIQTQAVTYVVQRMTSLAALFYLAAVVLYLRWRLGAASGNRAGRAAGYASVLAAIVLAMLTKEIALTLPFAIALVELSLLEPARRDLFALVPILVTLTIVPGIRVVYQHASLAGGFGAMD